MQLSQLFKDFDALQNIYGEKDLCAVYGCGKIKKPKAILVFMNPTARNISSNKSWTGIRAPWIGTKNIWKMLYQIGFINRKIADEIERRKPSDWDGLFAEKVYKEVCRNSFYITNLSKATQSDAKPLPNKLFKSYVDLLIKEISFIQPKVVITFGNQVSSILLQKNIKVSDFRKKCEFLEIGGKKFKIFPVYYPVGQGMRNINMAKEDVQWILKSEGI